MKKFVLFAAAVAMSSGAFALSISETCTPFSASAGTNYFTPGPVTSGVSTCAAFSTLPVGDTFVSEQIVLSADYTGGVGITTNTTQTTFGTEFADVLTVSGTGTSSNYSDSYGTPNDPSAGTNFYIYTTGITSSTYTSSFNESYSVSVTQGSVQGVSGQVYAILNYSSAVPEPGTMGILGGGLLALSLVGRKLVRK